MASDERTQAQLMAAKLATLIDAVERGRVPYTPFRGYLPAMRWALACLEEHPEYDGRSGLTTGRLMAYRDDLYPSG